MGYFDPAEARRIAGMKWEGDARWTDPRPSLAHTHPQSDVTGLVSDLAAKAASAHIHAQSDVTGLVSSLEAKAALAHTHGQADVTNLTTDLAAKEATANKDAANGYAGLNASSRVTSGVDTTDDIIIDLATAGLVLKDTQGTPHYWRLGVTVLGVLTITDIGTEKP